MKLKVSFYVCNAHGVPKHTGELLGHIGELFGHTGDCPDREDKPDYRNNEFGFRVYVSIDHAHRLYWENSGAF